MMMMMMMMYTSWLELCVYFAFFFAVSQVIIYLCAENKNKYMGNVVPTVWGYCNSVVTLEFSGVEGCVFHFACAGLLSEYPWTITRYSPRSCHSYKPQFVAFAKFCVLWQWKSKFILRFWWCHFGLNSTNVDTLLNFCDAVRRHCIPKPFFHTVLMLEESANDTHDATQGTSHTSRTKSDG
jgi:hypothetical protein